MYLVSYLVFQCWLLVRLLNQDINYTLLYHYTLIVKYGIIIDLVHIK
jgi:hypothetical protein